LLTIPVTKKSINLNDRQTPEKVAAQKVYGINQKGLERRAPKN
jgi:hypothetical protein|tara:strand:- start:438 stop:566 length:129 start_codon:yes stop_codon:yes gene_type:complete